MKVLVTGVNGQLGYDVCRHLNQLCINNKGVDICDFDLGDPVATTAAIYSYQPDWVMHCAAFTATDKAEIDRDACMHANVDGTRNVANACSVIGAKMLYISTDYVFSGIGQTPFEVDSRKDPLNVYAESKYLGELEVQDILPANQYYIVRVSWVFGINGNNFVKTMLRICKDRDSINVVVDQIGSPTYTRDLAVLLCDMIQTNKYGIYHATNEGYCSWYEFAVEIFKQTGLTCTVIPILTAQYPTPAKRPLNSCLSKASLDEGGFSRLPSWKDALRRYLIELDIQSNS